MSFTKSDIVKNIAFSASVKRIDAQKILSLFLENIVVESKNRNVKLANFGCFYSKQSPKRIGRNPKTREEYNIPSIKKISFRVSDKVKKFLN